MAKAIMTKYIPQTERKPSRIKAYDSDGNSITLSYGSQDNPARDVAIALCHKMNWTGTLVQGGTDKGEVFVWFDTNELIHVR